MQTKDNVQIQQQIIDDSALSESSESELSEDEAHTSQSFESCLKEVNLLKQRLQRKINTIKKLKARNEKLERNSDICRDLNVQLQQKLISCKCKAEEENVILLEFFVFLHSWLIE